MHFAKYVTIRQKAREIKGLLEKGFLKSFYFSNWSQKLHIFWGSKNLKAYYNYLAIIQKVGDKITEQISIIEKYLSIHAQKGFLLARTEKAYFLNLWWNIIFSLSSFWWFFFKHFIRFDLFRWNWRDSVFSNILQVPIHFAYGIIYHI